MSFEESEWPILCPIRCHFYFVWCKPCWFSLFLCAKADDGKPLFDGDGNFVGMDIFYDKGSRHVFVKGSVIFENLVEFANRIRVPARQQERYRYVSSWIYKQYFSSLLIYTCLSSVMAVVSHLVVVIVSRGRIRTGICIFLKLWILPYELLDFFGTRMI